MYKKKVEVRESPIEGRGVFAKEDIPNGELVWIFEKDHDLIMTEQEFRILPEQKKKEIEKIGYLSPWTSRWIFPPEHDAARYTNHSKKNNLTAIFNQKISAEPYFVANKNIRKGEELTNNYYEFDLLIQTTKPDWSI